LAVEPLTRSVGGKDRTSLSNEGTDGAPELWEQRGHERRRSVRVA
jgi:hypothetical protein